MSYINISGKNIYFESYGMSKTMTLIYLHGGPGASCLDFTNTAKALGPKVHVIAFDQYGVLRSDEIAASEPYTMSTQADMIDEMRQKLNIKNWSVLGHSYGGALAVYYTNKYPQAVEKIILECPSLDFVDSARSIAEYLSDYIQSLGNRTAVDLCHKIQNNSFRNNGVVFDTLNLLEYVQDMKSRNYLHGISFDQYMSSFSTFGITAEMWQRAETHLMRLIQDDAFIDNYLPILKKLNKPTLLLKGTYDPACSSNQVEFISNLPQASVVKFENSGHFPRIEEPDKYITAVNAFMAR